MTVHWAIRYGNHVLSKFSILHLCIGSWTFCNIL